MSLSYYLADDQLSNLKSQIQKLKTELADKTAKITMLELQIQSENFPYRGKVAELETNLASYKKKVKFENSTYSKGDFSRNICL